MYIYIYCPEERRPVSLSSPVLFSRSVSRPLSCLVGVIRFLPCPSPNHLARAVQTKQKPVSRVLFLTETVSLFDSFVF